MPFRRWPPAPISLVFDWLKSRDVRSIVDDVFGLWAGFSGQN